MAGDEHREYLTGLAVQVVEMGGSDLHLKVPAPPAIRARGQLAYLEGHPPLGPEDTATILRSEEALRMASRPQDFRLMVQASGLPGARI